MGPEERKIMEEIETEELKLNKREKKARKEMGRSGCSEEFYDEWN